MLDLQRSVLTMSAHPMYIICQGKGFKVRHFPFQVTLALQQKPLRANSMLRSRQVARAGFLEGVAFRMFQASS